MFTLKSQKQLAKAINKARATKPRLSVNFFSSYTVERAAGLKGQIEWQTIKGQP